MRTIILLLAGLALSLGHACRTVKNRAESNKREISLESQSSNWSWQHYDSAGRFWYYQSDSPFYYHPQQGLYGQQGFLAVAQRHVKHEQGQQNEQRLDYQQDEQSEQKQELKPALRSQLAYVLLLLLIILGFAVRFRKSIKKPKL